MQEMTRGRMLEASRGIDDGPGSTRHQAAPGIISNSSSSWGKHRVVSRDNPLKPLKLWRVREAGEEEKWALEAMIGERDAWFKEQVIGSRACSSQEPVLEHYNCVVDILGRSGQLLEAEEFIGCMLLEPEAATWGALLGGCGIHRDAKRGVVAAENVLRLSPDEDGAKTLLAQRSH